mgnify:CR=1 FL=1
MKPDQIKKIFYALLASWTVMFFFLPIHHQEWIISPAEEFQGWQFVAIDGSLSFWILGYGLNHRYAFFRSVNGSTFPCDDWGWHLTPYPYPRPAYSILVKVGVRT